MKSIPLSRGFLAQVDDEDFERVNAFKWSALVQVRPKGTKVYAVRNPTIDGKQTYIYMHGFILGVKGDCRGT